MAKKILITGVGGDIGQSVLRCLQETDYDFYVAGCDIDAYAAAKNQIDVFYKAPRATDDQEYLNLVERVIKERDIQYIFPTTEPEIEFYDRHRHIFDRKGVALFILSHDIISTFLDKFETVNFFKQHNVPYPRTYLLSDYKGELSFPFLLKSRRGCGAKKNTVIHTEDDIAYFRKKMPDAVVQEIIGNVDEEYTTGVFSDGEHIYSIAFRRYLGYGSLSKVAHLVYDKAIADLTVTIARAAGLVGLLNIQMRKTEQGYVPFEINPRFSSMVYIRHCFGFQDVKWWLDLEEGQTITYVPRYKRGTAVRTIGEVFFDRVQK